MCDDGLTIARAGTVAFDAAVEQLAPADAEDHPAVGRFGRLYYPAALEGQATDASFAVIVKDQPQVVVFCSVGIDGISYFGMPIQLRWSSDLGEKRFRLVVRSIIDYLCSIGKRYNSHICRIADAAGVTTTPLGRLLLAAGALPSLGIVAVADLSVTEDALLKAVRKSYHSLINWGRRSLQLSYVNAESPDRSAFDSYQAFHRRVAGRTTRPQKSWDIMFEMLCAGAGELTLGHDNTGTLVSATLIIDGRRTAQYGSAVYDREKFGKPLGHWPLFDAIVRAKRRGMQLFELGDIPPMGTTSEKEAAIGMFKRGFSNRLDYRLVWRLPLNTGGSA